MTTDRISYPSVASSITCSLNSLGASATVGRQSTVIDNSSNLYDDVLLICTITNASSGQAAPNAVYVYVSGSTDGTNFDQDDGVMGASDAAYTTGATTNLKLAMVLYCPTASKVYNKTCSVASLFGGIMPYKWAVVVVNNSGAALAASGNSLAFTPILWTNA